MGAIVLIVDHTANDKGKPCPVTNEQYKQGLRQTSWLILASLATSFLALRHLVPEVEGEKGMPFTLGNNATKVATVGSKLVSQTRLH